MFEKEKIAKEKVRYEKEKKIFVVRVESVFVCMFVESISGPEVITS